jgi:glycosyltransferase involved in cell wall biosynthesis
MKAKRPKVLVITGVFPPTPIAEADHIARLSGELAARGYSIDVLTSRNAAIADAPGCRVHRVMPSWRWADRARLVRFAREINPDIIFIWFIGHAYEFHPMITFAPTYLKAALPQVKVVTQITAPVGSRPKRYPLATRFLQKVTVFASGTNQIDYAYGTLMRDSDRFVAMASTHLERFADALPDLAAKSAVIPPPPLVPMSPPGEASRLRGRELLGVEKSAPVFTYFGRLYRGKGLETLIDAFAIVRKTMPDARLAIVGGPIAVQLEGAWKIEDLHARAERLGVDESIFWTGEFPFDSDIGSLYLRASDFAVLPFDEGAALNNSSIAACAAHDLPVITTLGKQIEPDFIDSENTLLVPASDAQALANAMTRLASDPALQARLRIGIQALGRTHFSWDASVNRTVAVFDDVLADRVELVES